MALFIIEHMEPKVWKWCWLEYKHISKIVGKNNLLFTNVNQGADKLRKLGRVQKKSVSELSLSKPCLLDPSAGSVLKPSDKFETFIFGGILGDDPPRERTDLLKQKLPKVPRKNLGKKQMSTDTAVLVTKMITDGKEFRNINFKDSIEIKLGIAESVILPYRYVIRDGKPVLAPGLKTLLRTQKGF